MQAITAKRVFIVLIAVFSISFLVGCAGMEKRPADRTGWFFYYPSPLVNADRELDDARKFGKDKECPQEFNALKDRVDEVWSVYRGCDTEGAIIMANEATAKIKALCPRKPVAEMKPQPMPEPKPEEKVIAPAPEPKAEEKVIVVALEDVHFDHDKSTLTKEAQVILRRNIQVLKENPDMKIVIKGHTSASGSEEYNHALSHRRAASVEAFLINEGGIASNRLSKIGYGETMLEMPEPNPKIIESAAAKANRRVVFEIVVK
ncbi:MAG: OmpA family protein [Nitrospirae bacterium]|nr:OmpA family protein [Nitrospirota bacterium]